MESKEAPKNRRLSIISRLLNRISPFRTKAGETSNPTRVTCYQCGACCRHWDIPIQEIWQYVQPLDIKNLSKKIKTVPFTVEKAMIRVYGRCNYLVDGNKCRIYWRRPRICREFFCNTTEKGRVQ